MTLFRKMPLERVLAGAGGLKRVFGGFSLVMMGVGVIVGSGIFVITGTAAVKAGPALVLSFLIAGAACACAALCYAELSTMMPAAGSAYTFAYVGLGELAGWFLGWCLTLEYVVSMAAVSVGWSAYCAAIFASLGIPLPTALTTATVNGGLFNLPAVVIITLMMMVMLAGARESARLNNILVVIKVGVILLFILLGVKEINLANWQPFMPEGFDGVFAGAATVFFAYIGFDCIANSAEETIDPKRNLPVGLLGSLGIVTVLYIAVTLVLTGLVPYKNFAGVADPVAYALLQAGVNWGSALVSLGAVCGLATGVLVLMYSASRLFFAMSRDGLLPKLFSKVEKSTGTPEAALVLVWLAGMVFAGVLPIGIIADLVNIGTISAFITVSVTLLVLRKTMPHTERGFVLPLVPLIPIAAIVSCGFLALQLPALTWVAFCAWTSLGMILYFSYGYAHSRLGQEARRARSLA